MVVRKYVYHRRIALNDLSLTAFVAGITITNFNNFITSEINIFIPFGKAFTLSRTSRNVSQPPKGRKEMFLVGYLTHHA